MLSFLVAVSCFASVFSETSDPETYLETCDENEHCHIHPKWKFTSFPAHKIVTKENVGGGDEPSLILNPKQLKGRLGTLTLSWENVSFTSQYDYIALFNGSGDELVYNAPPLQYKYICPAYHDCKYPPNSGSLQFKILNRRTEYTFAYIKQEGAYREIQAVSDTFSFGNDVYMPMNTHLALISASTNHFKVAKKAYKIREELAQNDFAMQVMWVQKETKQPSVKYGITKSELDSTVRAYNITTYDPSMLCDAEYGQPAALGGWFTPGYFINAVLFDLKPSTQYFYQVGDGNYGWTEVANFTTPPLHGSYQPRDDTIKFVAFADLGQVPMDFSLQHSWDWNDHGELYSINTTRTIERYYMEGQNEYSDFVIHTGDISYAVGFISEWDNFMWQIEPMASHLPYMTGIGNHEYSWSGEWKPSSDVVSPDSYGTSDGGGECGVPYNSLFPFSAVNPHSPPTPAERKPWYYFDYGTTRTIIMSTEHDFSKNSDQWNWIQTVLSTTDRSLFPWIFVTGHRPMYVDCDWDGDATLSHFLVNELEPLLIEYKVAVGMWGHTHAYGRTCVTADFECVDVGKGLTHFVMGMAGYRLGRCDPQPPLEPFVKTSIEYYGFLHFTVFNESKAYGKFIDAEQNTIIDDFYIDNPYSAA